MAATLRVRNASSVKRLVRAGALERLADRICTGEGVKGEVEISVLLCDDDTMTDLNRQYRNKRTPTDVLSFEQPEVPGQSPAVLGDVVISLETAKRQCSGDRQRMRAEVDLLFCHGLLHLLGYDHAEPSEEKEMCRKQAEYLGIPEDSAWFSDPSAARS